MGLFSIIWFYKALNHFLITYTLVFVLLIIIVRNFWVNGLMNRNHFGNKMIFDSKIKNESFVNKHDEQS